MNIYVQIDKSNSASVDVMSFSAEVSDDGKWAEVAIKTGKDGPMVRVDGEPKSLRRMLKAMLTGLNVHGRGR